MAQFRSTYTTSQILDLLLHLNKVLEEKSDRLSICPSFSKVEVYTERLFELLMDRVVQLDQKALRVAFDIKHSEPQDLEKKFDEISEFYQPFVRYCREDAPGSFDQELILKIKANIPKIHKLLSNYI